MVRSDGLRSGRRRSMNYRCKEGLLCDQDPERACVRGVAEQRAEPCLRLVGTKASGRSSSDPVLFITSGLRGLSSRDEEE
ncbi:hypothetical protein NDU88_000557 [Pleurodeles waltl]|uniref:Uncharacterized protein n=1 Tax=Pleurodeles waltl TaxID=8319 RepID=A0AAV7URM7_PLEWA|nr:hypothetical protein NDU88_000557 [Pleurodeles waltl]